MARRIKIATTICSILIAITALCYGVYAALQTTFNVSGQMSFSSTADVMVEVTKVDVYQGDLNSNLVTKHGSVPKYSNTITYEGGYSTTNPQTSAETTFNSLTFNDDTNQVVRPYLIFEIYYKNHSQNAVRADLNPTDAATNMSVLPTNVVFRSSSNQAVSTFTNTLSAATSLTSPTVTGAPTTTANTENKAFIVILYLNNLNSSITSGTTTLNITFTKVQ